MKPEINEERLNPKMGTIAIGKKYLRDVEVYPLSLGDQFEVSDLFTEILSMFVILMQAGEEDQTQTAIGMTTTIFRIARENLGKIISLTTDEDPDIMVKEITNDQVEAYLNLIYQMNFEDVSKNLQTLLSNLKTKLQSDK